MKEIINELRISMEHELYQVGMTPRTNYPGSQELHDAEHCKKAQEYQRAILILQERASSVVINDDLEDIQSYIYAAVRSTTDGKTPSVDYLDALAQGLLERLEKNKTNNILMSPSKHNLIDLLIELKRGRPALQQDFLDETIARLERITIVVPD